MPEFRLAKVKGRYYAEWYVEGRPRRRHRRSLSTDDLERAKPAFVEFKRAFTLVAAGNPVDMSGIYAAYVSDREAQDKPSVPRMKDAWKRLQATFGSLMPSQISEDLCRSYTKARYVDGVGAGTVHVELGYLRAALRFAKTKRRWIAEEPYIPLPRKPQPRDIHLTKAEARKLIAAAVMPHLKLFLIIALSSAGRAAAILDLTWSRIDFDRRKILLQDPDKPVTVKGRATVPMNDMAHEALLEAKRGAITPYVIEWGGKKVQSVKRGVVRAAERAGLKCSPHMLRHSAAVWMAEDGVPMEEISQYLGHRDIETTRRIYARFSPDHLRRAARALEL